MKLASLLLALLGCLCAPAHAAARPNILLIVSDDHGYADTGFNGCRDIPTPHLDALARSGLRCISGYVTHPFCSPTRAGLLTGRYQARFGHENNPGFNRTNASAGLPLTEKLLPAHLKAAGYATGWIGKWHLGAAPELHPTQRGFTETFGFLGGGHRFRNWEVNPQVEYQIALERGTVAVEEKEHLTVAFGREADAFVRRHPDQPWFLYLAFHAPHQPSEPTPERLALFAHLPDPKRRAYAAQVSLMDDAIGRTLAAVRETRQEQRTLVFFFSDNGGPIKQGAPNGSVNSPLRAGKGELYEGGVRVPFVIAWPGKLPAGKDYPLPVSSLDVFATALAQAGVAMPTDKTYDSVNLVPLLTGEKRGAPHERLFWRTAGRAKMAVREGDLKLVRLKDQPDELYDLAADLGETTDLAARRPADAKRLAGALDAWDKELVEPAFGPPTPAKKAKPAK